MNNFLEDEWKLSATLNILFRSEWTENHSSNTQSSNRETTPLSCVHNLIVYGELSRCLHGQSWPVGPPLLIQPFLQKPTGHGDHSDGTQTTLRHLLIACYMQVLFSLWCFLTSYIVLTRVHLFWTNTKLWNVQNAHSTSLERQHIPDLDSGLDLANQTYHAAGLCRPSRQTLAWYLGLGTVLFNIK